VRGQFPHFEESEEARYIQKIRELELRILPAQQLPAKETAIDEVENLRRVVEAKLGSLTFIRDKLRDQNRKLHADLKRLEDAAASRGRLPQVQDGALGELGEKAARAARESEELKARVQNLRESIRTAEVSRAALEARLAAATAATAKAEQEEAQVEQEIDDLRKDGTKLQEQAKQLRRELAAREKELGGLLAPGVRQLRTGGGGTMNEALRVQRLRAARSPRTSRTGTMFKSC
jgi:chromosome segregation ATPase